MSLPTRLHALPLELKAQEKKCPADLHKANKRRLKGGLLVLADMGQTIYEPSLLKPLQNNLSGYHWSILTLASSSNKETNQQCIIEAVKYMQDNEAEPVFVVAVGRSYLDAINYFTEKKPPGVFGLILVSPFPFVDKTYKEPLSKWVKIRLPMLIIYNQRDYQPILDTVEAIRKAHKTEGNELLRLKKSQAGHVGSVNYNHGISKAMTSWLYFVKRNINFVARKKDTDE